MSQQKHLKTSNDLIVPARAIKYILEKQDTRDNKEAILDFLVNRVGSRNDFLRSDLLTELALLNIEKADTPAASQYLKQSYSLNPYNKLAFLKLSQTEPEVITPELYAQFLRFSMQLNPMDLNSSIEFARTVAQIGLYDTAYRAWKYSAYLFGYLYPNKQLPAEIYLPWAVAAVNSDGYVANAIEIAERIRQEDRFDIVLSAINAYASKKIGNVKLQRNILENSERKALTLAENGQIDNSTIAWFYCFAKVDSEQALAWANKAYSDDPDSNEVAALFGYAMAINDEHKLALEYVKDINDNQIALLGRSLIETSLGFDANAVEMAKAAVNIDETTLEAQQGKQMLKELGTMFVSQKDTTITAGDFKRNFGDDIVDEFITPEKLLSIRLKTGSGEFAYGRDLEADLIITNNTSQNIIIGPDSLFAGHVIVSVYIKGDINSKIEKFIDMQIRPGEPIEKNSAIIIPLKLSTGPLKEILITYPQAEFDIEVKVFLDPAIDEDGNILAEQSIIRPANINIKRDPVFITNKYLIRKLESISKGQQAQQIRSAKFVAGLLREQQAMKNFDEPLYRYLFIDQDLLVSALVKVLRDGDWTVRVQTMASLQYIDLDYRIVNILSELINDQDWPVRMLSTYLIARSQGPQFTKVLDWIAANDENNMTSQLAVTLGGKQPLPPEDPNEPEIVQQ